MSDEAEWEIVVVQESRWRHWWAIYHYGTLTTSDRTNYYLTRRAARRAASRRVRHLKTYPKQWTYDA